MRRRRLLFRVGWNLSRILCVLLLLSVVTGFGCRQEERRDHPLPKPVREKTVVQKQPAVVKAVAPAFEEARPPQPLKEKLPDRTALTGCDTISEQQLKQQLLLPRVAIIIDDMGYHQEIGDELLSLDLNLTFSFLPRAPFTEEQDERAWSLGRDILVHMPMEARDPTMDPGPGTLYLDDPLETIAPLMEKNLDSVPHAIGMNNHMGSRYTENRQAMRRVLAVVKKRGLFFVDSLTTPESVGFELAREIGIQSGARQIFLDNIHTQEDICRQLEKLIAYAVKHGQAIGIGHPNKATLTALTHCRKELLNKVRIVGIRELVR